MLRDTPTQAAVAAVLAAFLTWACLNMLRVIGDATPHHCLRTLIQFSAFSSFKQWIQSDQGQLPELWACSEHRKWHSCQWTVRVQFIGLG